MKKKSQIICIAIANCLLLTTYCNAQSLSPKVMPSSGGYFTGGGNSLSWTMGEPFHTTLQSSSGKLTQGFQQPYILLKILNLRAFIQGFYLGGGEMQAVLYNNSLSSSSVACDSISVELHAAGSPFGFVASVKTLLQTNGSAIARFPFSLANNSYFIVIRHRNSLETWSAVPIVFNNNVTIDFTEALNVAYGNNLCDLSDDNFAIWSGDVDQNGSIQLADYNEVESSSQLFLIGYQPADLTGDGLIESSDYSLIENNSQLFLTISRP